MVEKERVSFTETMLVFVCGHRLFFGVVTPVLVAVLHWTYLPMWSASPYTAVFHSLFWGYAVYMSWSLMTIPTHSFRDSSGDYFDYKSKPELLAMAFRNMLPSQLLSKLPVYLVWHCCQFFLADSSLWISIPVLVLLGIFCFGHVLVFEATITPGGDLLDAYGGMQGVAAALGVVFTHNFLAAMLLDFAFEYHLGISFQRMRETQLSDKCPQASGR